MKSNTLFSSIVGVVLLFLLWTSVFTVNQGHSAILLRLGEIVKNKSGQAIVLGPGLHFKLPFIVSIQDFDERLQSFSVDSSRILTAEQKYVVVDYYAKWRIENPAVYYTRTGGMSDRAEMLLEQKINDVLRQAFGVRQIQDIISGERSNITQILRDKANETAKELGISVIDVRIKGIDLPKEVRDSVFSRMRTQREQVATQHRAQGNASAESLRANADAQVAIEIAKAQAAAQKIRADGDAQAATIYAAAYQKDPQFYAFYRSLIAYQKAFSKQGTVMVLKPNSEFFKYFNEKPTAMNTKK